MKRSKSELKVSLLGSGYLVLAGILVLIFIFAIFAGGSLWYSESKGPFKNWTQVVDLEGDGDLDVVISHTRWEDVDISWAGIGRWINQGGGKFELVREAEQESFAGFAAGAGDVDQDGDPDIFVQEGRIHLLVNQGGQQGDQPGEFIASSGINTPPTYNEGYRDMGGMIRTGDLTGDGWLDAFVAGCCYGLDPTKPDYDLPHAPAASWVWINDGRMGKLVTGHILPMESLDGLPIREAAMGDLDGDGDLDLFAAVGKPTMGSTRSLDDLILLNDGTGKLAAFDQQLGNTDSTSVALGDVNGDKHLDVLVGTNRGAVLWINQGNEMGSGRPIFVQAEQSFEATQTASGRLGRWISTSAGELLGVYLPYGSTRSKAVFLEDFNGDGDLDVLLARVWGAELWLNNGQGEFRWPDVQLKYIEDTGVAAGDFDGDGDLDIFTGRNEPHYQVWWNDGKGIFSADN